MPTNIRAMLSVIVALATAVLVYFEMQAGSGGRAWLVLGLGAFMLVAVWLFPEAKRTGDRRK